MYRLIPNCNVHNLLGTWYEFVNAKMSHNILCDPKLTFKSIPITQAFDLQDIKCTSRTRCRQAATSRVRHNSRGPVPARYVRQSQLCPQLDVSDKNDKKMQDMSDRARYVLQKM